MKAVLFDLDDTLYAYKPCHSKGLEVVLSKIVNDWKVSWDDAEILYGKAREWIHNQLHNSAASHHRLLYMSKMSEFGGQNPVVYAKRLEDLYWQGYFSQMNLYPGVMDLLVGLKNSGILLGLVTDLTTDVQYKKLWHLGLESTFDAVVTSEEAGIEKPSQIMFQLVLEKLGLKRPQEAVMVGDSYSKDILGSNSLGIKGYWIQGDPERSSEMVIVFQDFVQLKELL